MCALINLKEIELKLELDLGYLILIELSSSFEFFPRAEHKLSSSPLEILLSWAWEAQSSACLHP